MVTVAVLVSVFVLALLIGADYQMGFPVLRCMLKAAFWIVVIACAIALAECL